MRRITWKELYKPENYIKPRTKLILHMKDYSNIRFISGFDYLTLCYWEDYLTGDDTELISIIFYKSDKSNKNINNSKWEVYKWNS